MTGQTGAGEAGAPRRATRQGRAIVAALRASPSFRSAQEIHAELRAGGQQIGLTTVYRHLQRLADDGDGRRAAPARGRGHVPPLPQRRAPSPHRLPPLRQKRRNRLPRAVGLGRPRRRVARLQRRQPRGRGLRRVRRLPRRAPLARDALRTTPSRGSAPAASRGSTPGAAKAASARRRSGDLHRALREPQEVSLYRRDGRRLAAAGAEGDEERHEVLGRGVCVAAARSLAKAGEGVDVARSPGPRAAHASNSLDQAGGGASMRKSRRNGRPWVRNPLPTTSTPSSRSGRRRAPSSNRRTGSSEGSEICSTGTSALGYMTSSGT